jgi:hypothetical protein
LVTGCGDAAVIVELVVVEVVAVVDVVVIVAAGVTAVVADGSVGVVVVVAVMVGIVVEVVGVVAPHGPPDAAARAVATPKAATTRPSRRKSARRIAKV